MKKYFKRLIKLNGVGVDIDEDVKSSIKIFDEYVKVNITKEEHLSGYLYKRNDIAIMYYDGSKYINVSRNIYSLFENIDGKIRNHFFKAILEGRFKINIKQLVIV